MGSKVLRPSGTSWDGFRLGVTGAWISSALSFLARAFLFFSINSLRGVASLDAPQRKDGVTSTLLGGQKIEEAMVGKPGEGQPVGLVLFEELDDLRVHFDRLAVPYQGLVLVR